MIGQDGSADFLLSVDFDRTVAIIAGPHLSITLKNNLNNLLVASGQNESILRIQSGLIIVLINEALRHLNNGSATEHLNIASVGNILNILGTIDSLVSNVTDLVRTHGSNELGASKDDSTTSISANHVHKALHILSIESVVFFAVGLGDTRSTVSRNQSLLNLIENRISQTLGNNLHDISHILGTIQHTVKVNGTGTANSMSFNGEGLGIQTEGLIDTRQTNLSQELLGTVLTNLALEHSLLAMTNSLDLGKHTDTVNNLLGNDIINGLNDNVKNIILISLELIDRGAHSAQLITKSIIHVFIGKILGSSAARSVEGKLFDFLNSSHILFTSSLYYASMQRNLTAGQPLGMVALALMTFSTGAPSIPSTGLVADRRI